MPLKIVKRAGSTHWQVYGTSSGYRFRFSTQTDCRDTAEAIRLKTEREAAERKTHGDAAVSTFAACAIHYIRAGGEARFLAPLVKRWGEWRVQQITAAEITRAAHELYPGKTTAWHVRAVYTPANAVLSKAAEAGLCKWAHVKAPAVTPAAEYPSGRIRPV